jgi:hypothetical protein
MNISRWARFVETAIDNYRLSFADQGKQTSILPIMTTDILNIKYKCGVI